MSDGPEAQGNSEALDSPEIKEILTKMLTILDGIFWAVGGPVAASHNKQIFTELNKPKGYNMPQIAVPSSMRIPPKKEGS